MSENSKMGSEDSRTYELVAYGIERTGFKHLPERIDAKNFSVDFEAFDTARRLNEFDGALIFQGIFEHIDIGMTRYGQPYSKSYCDRDELDRREKEIVLLLRKGGFVCIVLCKKFTDHHHTKDLKDFDLAKRLLNISGCYRYNFKNRWPHLEVKRDEFREFMDIYGAASSYFDIVGSGIEWRVIAKSDIKVTSWVHSDRVFYIPVLVPRADQARDFFDLLCKALVAAYNKLRLEVPTWVNGFRFNHEVSLIAQHSKLLKDAQAVGDDIRRLSDFKRVLIASGDKLVDAIKDVFEAGFGLAVNANDELREDLKILDADGTPIVFLEIKGTNSGVKRDHVSQADSHRDRAELPSEFPSVLIVNTHIKNARNIEEKDQEVAGDQVAHAANDNILILRTLDLLSLLKLHLANGLTRERFIDLLTTEKGWLRVVDGKIKVLHE